MENKRITLKEIAERCGVSVRAVHCAIYGKKGVSEETRKKILNEIEKTGFQVNLNASLLKKGEQHVTVLLPKPVNEEKYYYRGIWEGVKSVATFFSGQKIEFEYIESDCRSNEMARALKQLYEERSDSIQSLISLSDDKNSSIWAGKFGEKGIPTVVISTYKAEGDTISSVRVDHRKAGRLAGEFLNCSLRRKTGRILLLSGDRNIYSNYNYAEAFMDYMKENCPGLVIDVIEGYGREAIDEKLTQALSENTYLGAFIANARNTMHYCEVASQYEQTKNMITVGTDVFHELVPYFEDGTISASVYQYNKEQGARAVNIIYDRLTGRQAGNVAEEMPIALVMKYNYEFYVN